MRKSEVKDFKLICADLSLNRTGLAKLHYHADTRTVTLERKSVINNKGVRNSDKPHGQKLCEIITELKTYLVKDIDTIFVRQRWIYVTPTDACALAKVHGVADALAWGYHHKEFIDINPITIKKLVAGNGKAKKQEVAAGLEYYVGPQEYQYDDESDAVAVGVAWLIKNKYIDQKPEENHEAGNV